MSDVLKLSGPLKVGSLASAPSNPVNGYIYFDTTLGTFQMYQGGAFREVDVQTIDAHLNGANVSLHDADQIDYERADGSKKNIQASSDDVEAALTDLDDTIGALATSPTNYTPVDSDVVASHLAAIDSALSSAGGNEFVDNLFRIKDDSDATKKLAFQVGGIATATTRTITVPDANVDLGDIAINTSDISTNAGNISTNTGNIANNTTDISEIRTTTGTVDGDTHLGTFPGVTIPDSSTIKGALTSLETAVETKAADSEVVKKAGSTMDSNADLTFQGGGEVLGLPNTPSVGNAAASKTYVDNQVSALGTAAEWQDSVISRSPTPPGSPSTGDRYLVIATATGAWVGQENNISEYNGTSWVFSVPTTGTFVSVDSEPDGLYYFGGSTWTKKQFEVTTASNGLTKSGDDIQIDSSAVGAALSFNAGVLAVEVEGTALQIISDEIELILDGSTLSKSVTGLKVADSGISDLQISNSAGIDATKLHDGSVSNTEFGYLGGVTSSIQTQLGNKLGAVSEDLAPTLGGDLTLGSNTVIHDSDGMKRGSSTSNFLEEEYIHSVTLTASQTNSIISALTFQHAVFEGCEIVYKIKEATSSDVRIGTIRVVTNGTAVAINDVSTETSDVGISFSASVNGADIEIKYTSGANACTMRCDVKRIKA